MKKISFFLIALFIFPLFVSADSAYYARVTNRNGIEAYNDNERIIIPYDSMVEIYNYINGSIIYNDDSYNADLKDLVVKIEDNYDYLINEELFLVIVGKDAPIYNGPDFHHSTIKDKTIPKGTIITSYYNDTSFAYIEYNGVTGWIPVDYYEFDQENEKLRYAKIIDEPIISIISMEATMYDDIDGKEINMVLGPHSMLEYYYNVDTWYYINYKGNAGWVDIDRTSIVYPSKGENNYLKTTKEFETYDLISGQNVTIPKDVVIQFVYDNDMDYECENGVRFYAEYKSHLIYIDGCDNITRNITTEPIVVNKIDTIFIACIVCSFIIGIEVSYFIILKKKNIEKENVNS